MGKDLLIYINEQNKLDASAVANTFANTDTKNRAYINTLSAELIKKYLNSENIDTADVKSLHSVKKILEQVDISDIILKSLHIDVRAVYNENLIFIPKSHFEYDIIPDIYVVLLITKDVVNAKMLGFFEPGLINKNNKNDDYYFIEKEKLSSPDDFVRYVNEHANGLSSSISDDEFDKSKELIISYIDNDIQKSDVKILYKNLIKSAELREEFIEYENFETLSSKAMTDSAVQRHEITETAAVQDEFELFDKPETEETEEIEPIEQIEGTGQIEGLEGIDEVQELETTEETENSSDENPESLDILPEYTDLQTEQPDLAETSEESLEVLPLEFDNTEEFTETPEIEPVEQEAAEITDDALEVLPVEDTTLEIDSNLEDISPIEEEKPQDETPIDSVDSIDELEPIASFENIENDNETNENISLDNINDFETTVNDENIESETVSFDTLEKAIITEMPEIYDENEEKTEEASFGKNLLDNLSAEDEENAQTEETVNYANDGNYENYNSEADLSSTDTSENTDYSENYEETNPDKLNVLYNEDSSTEAAMADISELEELETLPEAENTEAETKTGFDIRKISDLISGSDKKPLIIASVLVVIAAFAGFHFMKPKAETEQVQTPAPNEIADTNPLESEEKDNVPDDNALATNTPEVKETVNIEVPNNKAVQEIKNNAVQQPKASDVYMNVSKVVWDVPSELSANTDIQNYLRTAGKSIKVSLSADLLLASEYAYANFVKIGLTLSQTGNIQSSRIVSSSGSKQIDDIVLQCVKDTLNTVKPANGAVTSPNFNLGIIIYF